LRRHVLEVYRFRGLNDPTVYLNDQDQGLLQSYRANFLSLVWYHLNTQQRSEALALLRRMEEIMPEAVIPLHSLEAFLHLGRLYAQAGDSTALSRRLHHALQYYYLSPQQKLDMATLYWKNLGQANPAESLANAVLKENPNWGPAEQWLQEFYSMNSASTKKAPPDHP
jgi:tetratricopeptide (TPR) repeat protein